MVSCNGEFIKDDDKAIYFIMYNKLSSRVDGGLVKTQFIGKFIDGVIIQFISPTVDNECSKK